MIACQIILISFSFDKNSFICNNVRMITKEIQVKDYLSKSKIGAYAINPYIGCPHACKYCYACFMRRFTLHSEKWGDFTDIKLCQTPINLERIKGKEVFISSVTDCYNPLEEKYQITRNILTQLIPSDADIQISTKSKLILRDIDILKQIKHLTIAISVNTLDEKFKNDMDRASSIVDRLKTLKTLHENGLHTVLFMSPIFIGITDYKQIIEETKSYIDEYWFEDLNLRGGYKKVILDYIKSNYPNLYPIYEEIYIKNKKDKLYAHDQEIILFCNQNNINFKAYFHHEEVMKEKVHRRGNDRFVQTSLWN